MTLQSFKDTYLGKQVEFHSYGSGSYAQCVDLVNLYINTVLDNNTKDYTEIIGTNAKDFNTRYDPEDFDFIANTPLGVPQEGDIIVWNGKVGGGAGHVAIFLEGDVNSFKSLDQNWSQKERVTLETHNYTNVSGWLRAKKVASNEKPCNERRDELWNFTKEALLKLGVEQKDIDKYSEKIDKLLGFVDSYIESTKKSIAGHQSRVTDLEKQNEKLTGELGVANEKVKIYKKELADKDVECQRRVTELEILLQEAKKDSPDLEKLVDDYEGMLGVEREKNLQLQKKYDKARVDLARVTSQLKALPFIEKLKLLFL